MGNSAAAVSGMHWVATAGTQYRLKSDQKQDNDGLSRQATVAVVISLVNVLRAMTVCYN